MNKGEKLLFVSFSILDIYENQYLIIISYLVRSRAHSRARDIFSDSSPP